ncbi:hypothetical protein [Allorhodopirellula solitaria]|uniref:Uncharacterized protein n=1 Tax=Allorhodopirellula solitaria TaxID=2527987 RepID=A0A5C5XX01_9BACT|nr:hypothetical protein [Allorhodopirellula solitaria]TWT67059.1 hypothetical protein CA85_19050 [Allorhodopirellula solitaria]
MKTASGCRIGRACWAGRDTGATLMPSSPDGYGEPLSTVGQFSRGQGVFEMRVI